jgi:hypothetical protein
MEETGSSQTVAKQPNRRIPMLVAAPKDYLIGPIFAARPQMGQRKVVVGDREYVIGGFDPFDRTANPPALDVTHARALFSLLSFRRDGETTQLIRFSIYEFCRRYAASNGGRYARAILKILGDLAKSYIRVTDTVTGIGHQYRLIERIDFETRPPRRRDSKLALSGQQEMFFNGCTLSPEFAGLLDNIAELQCLKLNVLTSIRAPLAQAIYLYIPSRAYYRSQANPFEITLTNLLREVSYPIPKHRSVRFKIFNQRQNIGQSIIQQLDGLEMVKGIFRVRVVETNDGEDYKLQAWAENNARQKALPKNSKLFAAWCASGRSPAEFEKQLANPAPLDDHEIDLLEKAAVRVEGNERFFTIAKALLPRARFLEILHEAKGDEMEGHKAKKNPTARLIWRITSAIREPLSVHFPGRTGLDN